MSNSAAPDTTATAASAPKSNGAYDKDADVKLVAQSLSQAIQRDVAVTTALEERVKRFECFMSDDTDAEEYERLTAALQSAAGTFKQPIKFGSHRDAFHCDGCRTLRESAQRALLISKPLLAALQLHSVPLEKACALVERVHHCSIVYATAILNGESRDVKAAGSYMIEMSNNITTWTQEARSILISGLPGQESSSSADGPLPRLLPLVNNGCTEQ